MNIDFEIVHLFLVLSVEINVSFDAGGDRSVWEGHRSSTVQTSHLSPDYTRLFHGQSAEDLLLPFWHLFVQFSQKRPPQYLVVLGLQDHVASLGESLGGHQMGLMTGE